MQWIEREWLLMNEDWLISWDWGWEGHELKSTALPLFIAFGLKFVNVLKRLLEILLFEWSLSLELAEGFLLGLIVSCGRWLAGWLYRWLAGWLHRWLACCIDGWMAGWMNGIGDIEMPHNSNWINRSSSSSIIDPYAVTDHASQFTDQIEDVARQSWKFKSFIEGYQAAFTAIEKTPQPVIAAIHGLCVGGGWCSVIEVRWKWRQWRWRWKWWVYDLCMQGVDLACACDIRLCTKDAWFCIKEVDIGETLAMKLISNSHAHELLIFLVDHHFHSNT